MEPTLLCGGILPWSYIKLKMDREFLSSVICSFTFLYSLGTFPYLRMNLGVTILMTAIRVGEC